MNNRALPVYVADTHALYWYWREPGRLSPAADAAFRLAEAGEARIIAPAIVVAEIFYLSQKLGSPLLPSVFLADLAGSPEFVFSELGQVQLEKMEEVQGVSEIHDRLIVAEALVHQAPLITRDQLLRQSGVVEVIW